MEFCGEDLLKSNIEVSSVGFHSMWALIFGDRFRAHLRTFLLRCIKEANIENFHVKNSIRVSKKLMRRIEPTNN